VSASSPDSPRPAPRFGFQWGNYRYEVHGDVAAHPDYDAGLLASRQLTLPGYPEVVGQSRLVELKPFFPHQHPSGAVDRCIEEVRRAGLVRHPNLAGIWGCVFDDTRPYVLMEHLPGCFLLTLLDAAVAVGAGCLPPTWPTCPRSWRMGSTMCTARRTRRRGR
jgi:hypothetical protein